MRYWAYHAREHAENDEKVQKTIQDLLSGARRVLMDEISPSFSLRLHWSSRSNGQSILHILAANGMVALSRSLLNGTFIGVRSQAEN
jgi:hypothetical protein